MKIALGLLVVATACALAVFCTPDGEGSFTLLRLLRSAGWWLFLPVLACVLFRYR